MRRLLLGLLGLLLVLVLVALIGLLWAHVAIRRDRGPLPDAVALAGIGAVGDLPVRLSWIDTARQPMPRAAVLDPDQDPDPTAAYVMSHPSFVLEWADGRLLLIDVGMTPEGARSFGWPLEKVSAAGPIEPLAATADQLGDAARRVGGVLFTHLHIDHVGGIGALCAVHPAPLPVFMTPAQAEHGNYTTRPGRRQLEAAPCVRQTRLEAGPLATVPGFPGVGVIAAGGHTPGTQVVVARVGAVDYIFTGDVVNALDGVVHDVPKPFLYSLLIVPEDTERLGELRQWLRTVAHDRSAVLLVSHDELRIRASGIPAWR